MNLYNQEELDRIKKQKDINDKLEELLERKRGEWNEMISPLFAILKLKFDNNNSQSLLESQSQSLAFRQNINEEISFFLNKRIKEEVKLKKIKQDKFVFYATGFGLKTNMGEKSLLIDGHLAENERNILLIDNHVEFLRSCVKNLESFGYTVKNMIDLMNYLGRQ